jgi:iron complex transport system substrate-binding protein
VPVVQPEPEAEDFFRRQCETFRTVTTAEPTGKTAAFFHLSASGGVVVRRQADYVTRMIELAGGKSALTELPESESALSTVTIQMEAFYAQAREADVLIYNSTAAREVRNLEEFLALNPLFRDFKAVKEGNVWCTDKSMFQRSSAAADMIRELHMVFSGGEADGMEYLYRLE